MRMFWGWNAYKMLVGICTLTKILIKFFSNDIASKFKIIIDGDHSFAIFAYPTLGKWV